MLVEGNFPQAGSPVEAMQTLEAQRKEERARLLEVIEVAPLEKLYVVDASITAELKKLQAELAELIEQEKENPESVDAIVGMIENKDRARGLIELQAILMDVLKRRENEGLKKAA